VLVADIAEKFVLDEGAAERPARRVAVQFRHFFIARDVAVLLVKIGRCIQPIGSTMNIGPP
jgi:hypothetical protein